MLAGNVLNHAVTRGLIAETPLKRLSKTERPRVRNKSEPRILTREETAALIAKTPKPYRALIATTAVTGARQSEVLGLTWECIDFEAGVIRFRHQLSRAKRDAPARLVPLKSGGDRRDVEMIPALAKLLAQHKLASHYAQDVDFVFATSTGRPVYYRNASSRGLDEGAKRAGLNADPSLPKLSFHDLRHSAISHLIRSGADVVRVQRFAGHSKPSTTLDVYAHEFRAREGDDIGQRLAVAFEGVL